MSTRFETLFTVGVSHAYYEGKCEDIHFILPEETAQRLRNGKLLARSREGMLYVLFEADESGAALAPIAGQRLRLGLELANPYFSNFTAVEADFATSGQLYRNSATPNVLNAPEKVALVGRIFSHTVIEAARPVTVVLKDASEHSLQSEVISAAENRTSVSYDLSARNAGAYTVQETASAGPKEAAYYCDAELVKAGVFGILEITIAEVFYATPASFQLTFSARKETLKYYCVITAAGLSELDSLKVTDAGAEEGESPIVFSKVPSTSFTAAEISPALLGDGSRRVVLFKSQVAVARRARGRRKIQLMKNNDVLIGNLPQPGPERSNADVIVSVAKL